MITVKGQNDLDTADEFTSIEKAFGFVRENEAVGRYLRGLKFLSEKIRGLKIFSGKIRGLKFLGKTAENTPGGYMPLKMTTPLYQGGGLITR